jgi:hypothetical protein
VPTIVNVLRGEAGSTRVTPYGVVGTVYSGQGIEAVWVSKRGEQVDPGWFVPDTVDLILLREGHLRVEFEAAELDAYIEARREGRRGSTWSRRSKVWVPGRADEGYRTGAADLWSQGDFEGVESASSVRDAALWVALLPQSRR